MINSINNFLKSTYKISGYIAAIFLVLVAVFILTGISSRIFGFYIRGLAEYSGYSMGAPLGISLFLIKLKTSSPT